MPLIQCMVLCHLFSLYSLYYAIYAVYMSLIQYMVGHVNAHPQSLGPTLKLFFKFTDLILGVF